SINPDNEVTLEYGSGALKSDRPFYCPSTETEAGKYIQPSNPALGPIFKRPTGILAHWILKIQDLDYEFEYIKGKQNTPSDYLSRFLDDIPLE
ncbi:hypothetical protein QYM36_009361, partial [Artemia franciscana]